MPPLQVLPEADSTGRAAVLDGGGACPPEDSNGLDGLGCRAYQARLGWGQGGLDGAVQGRACRGALVLWRARAALVSDGHERRAAQRERSGCARQGRRLCTRGANKVAASQPPLDARRSRSPLPVHPLPWPQDFLNELQEPGYKQSRQYRETLRKASAALNYKGV